MKGLDELTEDTKLFVFEEFEANPHYSFGDGTIMYQHSLHVLDFALELASEFTCDKTVVTLEALLHDIGKTYKADEETLHAKHHELGWKVCEKYLKSLKLTSEQMEELKKFFEKKTDSVESRIVKDADVIAFFADPRLHTKFKLWAEDRGKTDELSRKLAKFDSLHFSASKQLAQVHYDKLKQKWTA